VIQGIRGFIIRLVSIFGESQGGVALEGPVEVRCIVKIQFLYLDLVPGLGQDITV